MMTEIIIKKRRILSLPSQAAPAKVEPKKILKSKEKTLKQLEAEESLRRTKACRDWLSSKWPNIFDQQSMKPLAIGIYQEIKLAHVADGGVDVLGFGNAWPLKRSLSNWCQKTDYIKTLAEPEANRYNLQGEVVGTVTEEQREKALAVLRRRKVKLDL